MKRILIFILSAGLLLSGCGNNSSIGIIGGADGPTAVFVSKTGEKSEHNFGRFGEQYEKKLIKMINVDGELYFDSGLVSDAKVRCGTLDGELKKDVNEGEVPHGENTANFETDGYQNATSITKEVNIDGKWVIFKKYRHAVSKDFKYCFYIKGHLNNAAVDSELVVLTDNKDITFSQVYEPMLSSQADVGKEVRLVSHDYITTDEWGIMLSPKDVTATGVTYEIEQLGGRADGELQTGEWFELEISTDDGWKPVPKLAENTAWHSIAYAIKKNDITELKTDWTYLYGKLSPGYYKMKKEVMNLRKTGDFDKQIYELQFTVE